jgi:ribosome-binding protein aMBF1 (putative translation factor)
MIKYKGKKYNSFRDLSDKWMENKSYKKAYDELEFEFSLIRAIIDARLKKGITQKEIAEKMGTKQSSIARFESGKYNPTLAFVQKLASAVGTKIKIA